jgi:hypothetical protein
MHIFISYASEYRAVADRIAIGLRQEGHDVFFDRDQLPPGNSYDARIRDAIQQCNLLIFLISPESVAKSSYALTELGFAREKWKDPARRIVPVLVAKTNIEKVPAYLRAVSILAPEGDLVAEVLGTVARIGRQPDWHSKLWVRIALPLAVIAGAFVIWWINGDSVHPCHLALGVRSPRTPQVGQLIASVTSRGLTKDFFLSENGTGPVDVPLKSKEHWKIEIHGSNGVLFDPVHFFGCPDYLVERHLDGNNHISIRPR